MYEVHTYTLYVFISLIHLYLIKQPYQPCALKFACWDPGELREHEPKLILCGYNMFNQGFFTDKNKYSDHEELRALENHTNIILRLMDFQSKWSTSSTVTLDPPKHLAQSARDKPWLKTNRIWGNTKPKKLKALHVKSLSNTWVLGFGIHNHLIQITDFICKEKWVEGQKCTFDIKLLIQKVTTNTDSEF